MATVPELYKGVIYTVDVVQEGTLFYGRFTVYGADLDSPLNLSMGDTDWAEIDDSFPTRQAALEHATRSAQRAIDDL